MTIPVTWEESEQPSDDQIAGNVWFWAETYREFQEGLKIASEHLKRFEGIARELELKASPYDDQVQHLQTMIAWGDERLNRSGIYEITVRGVSYGSLRYLKAGILLRASQLLRRRQDVLSQERMVPKSILQAFDSRIQQLLNLAEQGVMKALRPAELFFEATAAKAHEASPTAVRPERSRNSPIK